MADPAPRPAGWRIVQVDLVGTAVFTVSAVWAALVFDGFALVQGVAVSLGLFAVGVFVFLWGYWTAVQRSRTEEISVAELYFLVGGPTPRSVKVPMLLVLAVQSIVALATALARPETDGRPGSTLAFGVLVPMFGLGLNGLWVARHGAFGPRRRRDPDAGSSSSAGPDGLEREHG
jgi:hypothetical protein